MDIAKNRALSLHSVMEKDQHIEKASYRTAKVGKELTRETDVLQKDISHITLWTMVLICCLFSAAQCMRNFDVSSSPQGKSSKVWLALYANSISEGSTVVPIITKLQPPQGEQREVLVLYYPTTGALSLADGSSLKNKRLIEGGAYLEYEVKLAHNRPVVVCSMYDEENKKLLKQAILSLVLPLVAEGGGAALDFSTPHSAPASPPRGPAGGPAPATPPLTLPVPSAPAEPDEQVQGNLGEQGLIIAPGLGDLIMRLCTAPPIVSRDAGKIIDRKDLRGYPIFPPIHSTVSRNSNICVRIFRKTDKESEFSVVYAGNEQKPAVQEGEMGGVILVLGPSLDKRSLQRQLGSFQVRIDDRLIKIQLPDLSYSD